MEFKKGFLYSLSCPLWHSNIYKLGNTGHHIKKRISTMQTSLYIDIEIKYQTSELRCCKFYEYVLKKLLVSYRVNPKREFFSVQIDDIKLIYDFFSDLDKQLDSDEKLSKYIEDNFNDYYKSINRKNKTIKIINDSSDKIKKNYSLDKRNKNRKIFIDTSNL